MFSRRRPVRLETERIVMAGDAETLRNSEDIQEFYLGKSEAGQRGQKRWKRRCWTAIDLAGSSVAWKPTS